MRGFLHHAQHDAVQHLHRGGRDGARGDLGHRIGAIVDGIVDREQRLHQLRLAHQAHRDFGHQRHGAFRTRQQAGKIVTGRVRRFAAGVDRRSVGQHGFDAQHVIGGDAVRQRMRTARVFRYVAADGAGLLAGRIGRVEISVALHGLRDFEIHHARLHHRAFIRQIDFENPVHARERDRPCRPRARSRRRSVPCPRRVRRSGCGARARCGPTPPPAAVDCGNTTSSGWALSTLPSYS